MEGLIEQYEKVGRTEKRGYRGKIEEIMEKMRKTMEKSGYLELEVKNLDAK